jgi:hypothetical protein
MKGTATGITTIEEGLILNSPELRILNVFYNWENYTVKIECLFNEEGAIFKHSRTFEFSTEGSGELTSTDIINLIKNHDILKVFVWA